MRKHRKASAFALATGVITALSAMLPNQAQAQEWPSRPIRLVIPFPAGGGPERTIRALSEGLQQRLGQPVVLDYRPGAAGNIGAAEKARSDPDGYTWMLAQESIVTINPQIYKDVGYPPKQLAPVALIGSFVNVLTCNPQVGVNTVAELVQKAKANPGRISYASSGAGSPGHLTMELLASSAGVTLTHIPYRGPMPAVQDLLGGHTDCGFLVASIVAEHIKAGRLVGLAGSGSKATVSLGDLPNVSDAGYPEVDATFWLGIFAPSGITPEINQRFQKALSETVQSEGVRSAMLDSDTQPEWATPAEARARLDEVSNRWGAVIKRIGLHLE